MRPEEVARAWWEAFDRGDYTAAANLLAPGTPVDWPVSGERMVGAAEWLAVKVAYPAATPWRGTIVDLVVQGPDVVTFTQVDDGEIFDFAISRFTIEDGMITRLVEFWPERTAPPSWRSTWVVPLADSDNPMIPRRERSS